jgi:FMN phosphatase YigB (HAD superfamily)
VADRFGRIFDIASTGYVPKPEAGAYRTVADALAIPPGAILHVDDLPANVAAAEGLGMTCILYSSRPQHAGLFHRQAGDRQALERLLSEILDP